MYYPGSRWITRGRASLAVAATGWETAPEQERLAASSTEEVVAGILRISGVEESSVGGGAAAVNG